MHKAGRLLGAERGFLATLVFFVVHIQPLCAQDRPKIEIVPILGHSSFVSSVAFSPDGARVLSGGGDNVRLWDAATGALVRTFTEHSGLVRSVAFSPDGTRVLSVLSGRGNTITLWDAGTGALIRAVGRHSEWVTSVAFSPDGTRLLSGGGDKLVRLWDAGTGALIRTFAGHSDWVNSVAFSPDGGRVLSGSGDKTIRLWDAETGAMIRTFAGHSGLVRSVAFSPDGARVLSGGDDAIRLWDAGTGGLIRTFAGRSSLVTSLAFSPDGARVLSGDADSSRLWDTATGALIHTFAGGISGLVHSAAFSPDGARVLSGGGDKTIRLWDAATGALIRTFAGHSSSVNSVAFSPDGVRVVSGGDDATIKLWDAGSTGALIRTFAGHSGSVKSVVFSPDGARVLSGGIDDTIRLWDAATGTLIRTFAAHSSSVTSVAFSPDGTRVLSGGSEEINDSTGYEEEPAQGIIRLWDADTGALIRTFVGRSGVVTSLAFSPEGSHVLTGSVDGTIRIWDAGTGGLIRTVGRHSEWVISVAFSPDGTRLLSGGGDKLIRLWDAGTGALICTFTGHSGSVNSVAFSPDGARVLSSSSDKTIRLWDAATGELNLTFAGHSDPGGSEVRSVAFSPDSTRVLSGSADGTVRIWDARKVSPTLHEDALLATLIGGRDAAGDWLAITPQGFFAEGHRVGRSGEDAQILAVIRGLDVTAIHQIHQSLFNPDLLREMLAGDSHGEVQEAAKVINLQNVLDSGPAPTVAIMSHPAHSQTTGDLVTIQARITDKGKGIGRIEWRVNGVTTAVRTKPGGGGPDYQVSEQLALDPGDNIIEIVAYNGSNMLASLPARTTVKLTAGHDAKKRKLHILAIGINKYKDRGDDISGSFFAPLELAVNDAIALGADLKRAGEGLYSEVQVTYALNEEATREGLAKKIDNLAREVQLRDSFILFAAAHGVSVGGRFYLIPQDYQGGKNADALARRAIGQDTLQDWLANRIRAKKAIVLLDTCRSGALVAGYLRPRESELLSEAGIGRLHEATGRPVLTAAALGQDALEGYMDHGVFTYALLDALRNGDTNHNGKIELSELVAYVQNKVPKLAVELGAGGGTLTGVKGVTAINRGPATSTDEQTARYGSRGEDFVLVNRLDPTTEALLRPTLPQKAHPSRPAGSNKKPVAPDWRSDVWRQ